MAPVTRGDIKNYIKVYLGVDIPDKRVCKGHNSPMEYLWHSYFTEPSTWFDDAHHRSLRAGELPLKDGLYDHPIDALWYSSITNTAARPRTGGIKEKNAWE
jgi:hypothetical protein